MPEQPALPRYTSENIGLSLKITIPSRKNWLIIILFGFWLMAWTCGEIVSCGLLVNLITNGIVINNLSSMGGVGLFLIWITGWTIGGGFTLYTWLWQFIGSEVIEVTGEALFIAHKILTFGKPKEFLTTNIKDLRVAPLTPDNILGFRQNRITWGVPPGALAFDHGAKTINFGSGCEEAEAKMILKEIWQAYPQYKPQ